MHIKYFWISNICQKFRNMKFDRAEKISHIIFSIFSFIEFSLCLLNKHEIKRNMSRYICFFVYVKFYIFHWDEWHNYIIISRYKKVIKNIWHLWLETANVESCTGLVLGFYRMFLSDSWRHACMFPHQHCSNPLSPLDFK